MYRGINDLKKSYQPRTNTVRHEKGDLVIDPQRILARCRDHFSQLFNAYGVSDVRQIEIHTAEPLVPGPGAFEVEMTTDKIKRHKSQGTHQIRAELIKAGGRKFTMRSKNLLIRFGIRSGRSRTMYLFIRWAIKQIIVIIETYDFCHLHTKCYPHPAVKTNSICSGN